jgi:hypothetical protein
MVRPGGYTTRTTANGETVRTFLDVGENPPPGVVLTYRLTTVPEEPLRLTFRDANGEEIRVFTSRKADDPPQPKELRAPAEVGWNRFVWDMRHAPATLIEGADPACKSPIPGPMVAPGTYSVTLALGETELSQSFQIVMPSNAPSTQSDLEAQHDLLLRVHHEVDRATTAINQMRDLRGQLDRLTKRLRDREETAEVATEAEALRDKVLEIERILLYPDLRTDWETYNYGVRLLGKLTSLSADVALGDYRPTDAAVELFDLLRVQLDEQLARFEKVKTEDLPAFKTRLGEADLTGVLVV